MLIRIDEKTRTLAKKYNLPIVQATSADKNNIAADEGRFSQGDYNDWREERQSWVTEFYSVERGSAAEQEYRETIHRPGLPH